MWCVSMVAVVISVVYVCVCVKVGGFVYFEAVICVVLRYGGGLSCYSSL